MHHCCKFNADEIYYLTDKKSFTKRKLSAGYCPVCNKLVAELSGVNKNGETRQRIFTEDDAKIYIHKCKKEIIYSMTECNLQNQKTKLFGRLPSVQRFFQPLRHRQCYQSPSFAYSSY